MKKFILIIVAILVLGWIYGYALSEDGFVQYFWLKIEKIGDSYNWWERLSKIYTWLDKLLQVWVLSDSQKSIVQDIVWKVKKYPWYAWMIWKEISFWKYNNLDEYCNQFDWASCDSFYCTNMKSWENETEIWIFTNNCFPKWGSFQLFWTINEINEIHSEYWWCSMEWAKANITYCK